jgi:hypothetical protein
MLAPGREHLRERYELSPQALACDKDQFLVLYYRLLSWLEQGKYHPPATDNLKYMMLYFK